MTYANGYSMRSTSLRPKVLWIEHGWSVDQLRTVDQCDAARDALTAAIIQTEELLNSPKASDLEWACKARTAFRLKQAALERTLEIRNRLLGETPERKLLAAIKDLDAELYFRAIVRLREKHPGFSI